MVGRINRTNSFATGIPAMLTKHWRKTCFKIITVSFNVALQTDPGHFTSNCCPDFTDNGQIVFSVTCNYTSRTSITPIQINCHAPAVRFVITGCFRAVRIKLNGTIVSCGMFFRVFQLFNGCCRGNIPTQLAGIPVSIYRVGFFID